MPPSPDYLNSRARARKRAVIKYAPQLVGAGIGYGGGRALGGSRPVSALAGVALGGAGRLLGRKLLSGSDIRDVRRQGLTPLNSSMIREVGHTPEGAYIRFNTGNLYRYKDVSPSEVQDLRDSESAGKHFARHLRDREYERVHAG
jgi:hypothetical protein